MGFKRDFRVGIDKAKHEIVQEMSGRLEQEIEAASERETWRKLLKARVIVTINIKKRKTKRLWQRLMIRQFC